MIIICLSMCSDQLHPDMLLDIYPSIRTDVSIKGLKSISSMSLQFTYQLLVLRANSQCGKETALNENTDKTNSQY